jgi:uncharacterized protein YdeI (YjbR/CyaY-like superfamily)
MTELHKNEPVVPFVDARAFARWLKTNHGKSKGLWLKLAKKDSGVKSITYASALDEALCWGWIDGQRGSWDEIFFVQRFTPRGPRSIWSKINIGKVAALTEAGRMQPSGLAQVQRAKENGQWERAYDGQKNMKPSPELLAALEANPKAAQFYATLSSQNRYAILHRLHTAKKPETRVRRLETFVAMLARGEKLHP